MTPLLKISALIAVSIVAGGIIGFSLSETSTKSLGGELDTILKKIALLEKMGVKVDWNDFGDSHEGLLKELRKELDALGKKLVGEGTDKKMPLGNDLPRPIPSPEGWEKKVLENRMIQFTRGRDIWWWDPIKGKWLIPPGITPSDPNPITPTGERLAGPGTY